MADSSNIDEVRKQALNRIDKSEFHYKLAFFVAGFVEVLFIASFLLLADLSNRLHLLLLISSVATYTIIGMGLFALGAHINKCIARALYAIEMNQQ